MGHLADPLSLVFIGCFLFGSLLLFLPVLLDQGPSNPAPGPGIEPNLSIEPDLSVEPDLGAEPDLSIEPDLGAEPDLGTEPDLDAEPDLSAEPDLDANSNQRVRTSQASIGGRTVQRSTRPLAASAQQNIRSFLGHIKLLTIILFSFSWGLSGGVLYNTTQFSPIIIVVLAFAIGIVFTGFTVWLLKIAFPIKTPDIRDPARWPGKVTITIPAGKVGEVGYTLTGGLYLSKPALSRDGRRLDRGQEVVIVGKQDGFAIVVRKPTSNHEKK